MSEPTAFLLALRASTADLVKGLTALQWSDADVSAPSLCAGWTRGHVLTHIARNADGIADTLGGALRGEIVARYPGGYEARNAAIEAGAGRAFSALVADVRESAERLDRVLGAVSDVNGWGLPTEDDEPAESWVFRRWREVEVHRLDLASEYSADRWPPLFVSTALPEAVSSLAPRLSGAVRIVVSPDGSVTNDLAGQDWVVGDGSPVEVSGPDWAVLAWLIGRPQAARDALSAMPELDRWR